LTSNRAAVLTELHCVCGCASEIPDHGRAEEARRADEEGRSEIRIGMPRVLSMYSQTPVFNSQDSARNSQVPRD